MKPTQPSAAALQQEKMQQQTAQIERLKQSLADTEKQLAEVERKAIAQSEYIQTHGLTEFEMSKLKAEFHGAMQGIRTEFENMVCQFRAANAAKRAYRKELTRVQDLIRDYWKIDAYPSYQFVYDALGEAEAAKLGIRFDDESDTTNGDHPAT